MRYTQRESIGGEIEHLDAFAHTRRQHGLCAGIALCVDRRDERNGQCVGHVGDEVFHACQRRILGSCLTDGQLLAPTLQVGEVLLHLADVFLFCDGLRQVFVYFVYELSAVLNHLVHCAILKELSVTIAKDAILLVLASIGVGAEYFWGERHAAALTKLLFHIMMC